MLPLIHCTLSLKCMKHSSKKIECLLFVFHILSSRHQPKCTCADVSIHMCNNYLIRCLSLYTDNRPFPNTQVFSHCVCRREWVVDVSKVVGGTFNFTPCNHRGSYWPYCQSGAAAWDRTKIEGSNPESAMTWYPGYLCLITRSHLINMIPGVIGSR